MTYCLQEGVVHGDALRDRTRSDKVSLENATPARNGFEIASLYVLEAQQRRRAAKTLRLPDTALPALHDPEDLEAYAGLTQRVLGKLYE